MENALTFRFEASDIQTLITGTDAGGYVHVTFYLELLEPDRTKVIMKAKMESFVPPDPLPRRQTGGCPVPPCRFAPSTAFTPGCIQLVDKIVAANKA